LKSSFISNSCIYPILLTIFSSFLIINSWSSPAFAGIIVLETLKTETITIKSTGEGVLPNDPSLTESQKKLMAKRAATVDAYRKLLERTKLIQVDSKTQLSDYMVKSDSLTAKVSGYIRGAEIVGYRQLEDGIAEVEVEIKLGPDFYNEIKAKIK